MDAVTKDIQIVCDTVRVVTKADPMARNRLRQNVDARRIVYKICRDTLNLTYLKTARFFNKNHASVLHGLKHFDDLFETDRQFRNNYKAVMQVISSLEFSENPIIDPHDIIVDYVNLQTDHIDVQQKYESLLRSLHRKVLENVNDMLKPIDNVVLHKIMADNNCSKTLQKTVHQILLKKNERL